MTSDVGTGGNKNATAGVAKINADGTGRICTGTAVYSSSCTDGIDIKLSYPDATNKSLVRAQAAATQSKPISSTEVNNIDVLLIARKVFNNTGVAMTGDFLSWNTVCAPTCPQRTGAVYMAPSADTSNNKVFYGLPQAKGVGTRQSITKRPVSKAVRSW